MNIFTYGSLMVPSVFVAVTGRNFRSQHACLSGYARFCVKHERYPGIIRAAGDMTDGVVYFEVDAQATEELDIFEGEYYQRTPVRITLDSQEIEAAETYVVKPEYRHLLSRRRWDVEEFKNKHQDEFMRQYVGFRKINGSNPFPSLLNGGVQ